MRSVPKRYGFWVATLVWAPLVTLLVAVVIFQHRFGWPCYALCLSVAEPAFICCFAAVRLLAPLRQRFAHKLPEDVFAWGVALAVLPGGVSLGMATARRTSVMLGEAFRGELVNAMPAIFFGTLIASVVVLWKGRSDARGLAREAEAERLKAQVAALTAQMNPHLLFNALNTVAALVATDPGKAEEVVVQLSELYRNVLRASENATHRLSEELALCRAYLEVERARFEDRLTTSIDVEEGLDPATIEVPVLVLQPLIENAVKHGIEPKREGGAIRVRIFARDTRVHLVVEDDGVGLGHSPRVGTGRGVANCRARLELAYGPAASLCVEPASPSGTRAELRMPRTSPR